jgi:hypothetical protein
MYRDNDMLTLPVLPPGKIHISIIVFAIVYGTPFKGEANIDH